MSAATIYTASDLKSRRREVLDKARAGRVRVRDTDGRSILMLPEEEVTLLDELYAWFRRHLVVEALLRIPRELRSVRDYGELTWLRVFDDDDLAEFASEFEEALLAAAGDRSLEPIERFEHDWRTTARQLDDPNRRSVLLGDVDEGDFVEVERPEQG